MTIQAISKPSSHFKSCTRSPMKPNDAHPFYLSLKATPKELEQHLSRYTSSQLESVLENGQTQLNELLRFALSEAAFNGNADLIEYIVGKWGSHPINMGNWYGLTPLNYACCSSQRSCTGPAAALLIEKRANVNILSETSNERSMTLLERTVTYSSCMEKDRSLIQLLLKNDAYLQDPPHLDPDEVEHLQQAQTELEETKKRAAKIQEVLDRTLPTDLIKLINQMDEEPLFPEPIEPMPAPSQTTDSTPSGCCIVM